MAYVFRLPVLFACISLLQLRYFLISLKSYIPFHPRLDDAFITSVILLDRHFTTLEKGICVHKLPSSLWLPGNQTLPFLVLASDGCHLLIVFAARLHICSTTPDMNARQELAQRRLAVGQHLAAVNFNSQAISLAIEVNG